MEISRTIISKIVIILGLLFGSSSFAQTPTPTPATGMQLMGAPTGLSAYDAGTPASGSTAATSPTIYGGNGGSLGGCATPSADSTCNSCDGTDNATSSPKWCNQTSIHTALVLKITLKSSTTTLFQGTPRIRYRLSGGGLTASDYTPDNAASPALVAGQPFTVEIKWNNLCYNTTGDGNCTSAINGVTLSVGIDNNNDGSLEEKVDFTLYLRSISADVATSSAGTQCPAGTLPSVSTEGVCDFTVIPGDEKVVVSDYGVTGNDLLTSTASIKFNRLIMFYKKGVVDATTVTNNSDYIILNLINNSPAEPSISDKWITGLENDVSHCFVLGNMDVTGNITHFLTLPANQSCATPSQVVGLLDDKHCFIATATYGSEMAPEVKTFREFRNKILLPHAAGKTLVRAYYKFGPKVAHLISQSDLLRSLSLSLLWPILIFVKLSLLMGLIPASLIALITVLLLKKATSRILQGRGLLKGDA